MAKEKEVKVLKIERETYQSKDSSERYSYFVKGVIRGKSVKASLIPGDIGGYDVLDIVFSEEKTADLVLVPYSMVDGRPVRKSMVMAMKPKTLMNMVKSINVKSSPDKQVINLCLKC